MSTATTRLFTPDEYLAREVKATYKSEYYRGEIFAMAGATWEHTRIKDNFSREAGNRFGDGPCVILTSDLRVKVSPTGLYTYPDAVVVCGKPQFENSKFDEHNATLLNPNVIVEVLSKSTERYDRGDKFGQYRTLSSLTEYILVSQTQPLVERFVRQKDDWMLTEFRGLDATFAFGSMKVEIPLAAIFKGIEFPDIPPSNTDEK